jgi:hypothetical protein
MSHENPIKKHQKNQKNLTKEQKNHKIHLKKSTNNNMSATHTEAFLFSIVLVVEPIFDPFCAVETKTIFILGHNFDLQMGPNITTTLSQ